MIHSLLLSGGFSGIPGLMIFLYLTLGLHETIDNLVMLCRLVEIFLFVSGLISRPDLWGQFLLQSQVVNVWGLIELPQNFRRWFHCGLIFTENLLLKLCKECLPVRWQGLASLWRISTSLCVTLLLWRRCRSSNTAIRSNGIILACTVISLWRWCS